MSSPLIFLTGFGPFEDVRENASGRLVEEVLASPPADWEFAGGVLPVSFERAPQRLETLLGELGARTPDLLLSLGVQREPGFRIELTARTRLRETARPDVDGRSAAEEHGGVESRAVGECGEGAEALLVDGAEQLEAFARVRPGWCVSRDAGGYVCERVFRAGLEWGRRSGRRALFLHVPRLEFTPLGEQREELLAFLRAVR